MNRWHENLEATVQEANLRVIEEGREAMSEILDTSIRHLSQQLGLSVVNTILGKVLHLCSFRLTYVHELRPTDFLQRVRYCQWFFNTLCPDDQLEKTFLF